SAVSSSTSRCSARPCRSWSAPTRSNATSSGNGSSACRRNRERADGGPATACPGRHGLQPGRQQVPMLRLYGSVAAPTMARWGHFEIHRASARAAGRGGGILVVTVSAEQAGGTVERCAMGWGRRVLLRARPARRPQPPPPPAAPHAHGVVAVGPDRGLPEAADAAGEARAAAGQADRPSHDAARGPRLLLAPPRRPPPALVGTRPAGRQGSRPGPNVSLQVSWPWLCSGRRAGAGKPSVI